MTTWTKIILLSTTKVISRLKVALTTPTPRVRTISIITGARLLTTQCWYSNPARSFSGLRIYGRPPMMVVNEWIRRAIGTLCGVVRTSIAPETFGTRAKWKSLTTNPADITTRVVTPLALITRPRWSTSVEKWHTRPVITYSSFSIVYGVSIPTIKKSGCCMVWVSRV